MQRFFHVNKAIIRGGKVICPANSIIFESGAAWAKTENEDGYHYHGKVCDSVLSQFEGKPYTFGRLEMGGNRGFKVVTLQSLAKEEEVK